MYDVLIIGGGAAGFYAAIHIAEADKTLKIGILERGKEVLNKVKVSGGGRCNVTHAQFDPTELVKNYPRGGKELLGPFHTHCSGDTVAFFEERGIPLKIESDGRMFPVNNSSQTIINCFINEAERLGIHVLRQRSVIAFSQKSTLSGNLWNITTLKGTYEAKKLLLATGSNPKIWSLLKEMGHTIVTPVPSLFTFNIKDERIKAIPGVSTKARVSVMKTGYNSKSRIPLASTKKPEALLTEEGPVLITHWGLSGPAILRLSAWGARILNEKNYDFSVRVNWLPEYHEDSVRDILIKLKSIETKKTVLRTKAVDIPRNLWINLVMAAGISTDLTWAEISKGQLQNLALQLTRSEFRVAGKSTFKEEFVTAGGVDLKEINFRTFESKLHPNLFFAGEVLNIDAITGGFNFQNAWTGGFIAARAIVNSI